MDLYSKPTDKHQYILPWSCHPPHVTKNIPYSLALRVRRICSDDKTFELRTSQLSDHLTKRGYRQNNISSAIEKVKHKSRSDLLSHKEKDSREVLPFVATYHPELPKIRQIIDNHWSTITSSVTHSIIFPNKPIVSFCRPKSHRDFLVRSKINYVDVPDNGNCSRCGDKRYKTCTSIQTTSHLTQSDSGATINIRNAINCKSQNVIM